MKKLKALGKALKDIRKEFGEDSIISIDTMSKMNAEVIPTGCISLDVASGIGGMPRGKVIEIFGPEMSGKSTIGLHLISMAQKIHPKETCAYIDAECSLDIDYAKRLGVDLSEDRLIISQPNTAEEGLSIVEKLVDSGTMSVIMVDSVAALVPKQEVEAGMDKQQMGLQARVMRKALRKLTTKVYKNKVCLIFINQLIAKMKTFGYQKPETTPGGRALKFFSSVRLEVKRKETTKEKGKSIGNGMSINVVKNKLAPPFKKADVPLIFGKGILLKKDFVTTCVNRGLIKVKNGSIYFKNNGVKTKVEFSKIKEEIIYNKEVYKKFVKALIPKQEVL